MGDDPRRDAARLRLVFAGLYFAEGAPMGFLWWALPVRLRAQGVEPAQVALLISWLVLPWAFKFLWAPLIDRVQHRRFGLSGWLLCAQSGMALTLLPLLLIDWREQYQLLVLLVLAHGVCAATQDAAVDSLAIRSVAPADRGTVNAFMQGGMLVARALFGGGALLVAATWSDDVLILAVVAVVALLMLFAVPVAHRLAGRPPATLEPSRVGEPQAREVALPSALGPTRGGYAAAWRAVLVQPSTWIGLLLATAVGGAFKGATALAGPFLLDQGASQEQIGSFFLLPVVASMIGGAALGGVLSDRAARRGSRLGLVAAAEATTILLVATIGALALTLAEAIPVLGFFALYVLLYVAIGAATSSAYALLMDATLPSLATTQFCLFMAGINLCEVWATRAAGWWIPSFGYGGAFLGLAGVSLLTLGLFVSLARGRLANR
ncbi:MAG: MFS transporter [Acidobacteria bacterium]|nr:MAG: MFS transporter [Acidobacteriota bacterium]REK05863.1 MAG: MFS transporter [Acidobacteriota bacterium]